jgi:septal ring factor EnvC (AmiA/AmiB activator)
MGWTRRLGFSLSFALVFSCYLSAQAASTISPVERLREILKEYETSTTELKSRIATLERQLTDSLQNSTQLTDNIPILKNQLSELKAQLIDLTNQSSIVNGQLDKFQERLETSRKQTENSLRSLQSSLDSQRTWGWVQTSVMAALAVGVAILLFK